MASTSLTLPLTSDRAACRCWARQSQKRRLCARPRLRCRRSVHCETKPGNGNAAWSLDTGEVLVAKHLGGHFEINSSITDGPTLSAPFDFAEDYGSKGKANGRESVGYCICEGVRSRAERI